VVVLPASWDVDVCSKSKMAAKLPEVRITMLVLQIHMSFQKQYRICDYVRNIWMSNNHGRRYLVLKIQDGSQLTGSSNISETMTRIIKIPTATTSFSWSSLVAFPISWDVDVYQKSNMTAKLPEVVITLLFLQMHMSFQNQYRSLWLCTNHVNVQQSWSTLPCVENPRWQSTNRK